MKLYNLVIVLNQSRKQVVMVKRQKPPFKDLYNLVGGKIEANETNEASAYRELSEETGITSQQIHLRQMLTSTYYLDEVTLHVFAGILQEEVQLVEEVNPLAWIDVDSDFLDGNQFAGNGNIAVMMQEVMKHMDDFND